MRLYSLIILLIVVGVFLWVRKCVDRKVEQVTGKEVVREDEELLGTWASKSPKGYVKFRLRRDGTLDYFISEHPGDTVVMNGTYTVAPANSTNAKYFPRLYGFNAAKDTLFNYYIRYVTPYGSTQKYDQLIVSPNSVFDTIEYKFYRLKQ